MKQICVKGEDIVSRDVLHAVLEQELSLPDWYGHNLDALYDCLTGELTEETEIRLENTEALLSHLGGYGTVFLRVLREAEEENPRLHIRVPDDYASEDD